GGLAEEDAFAVARLSADLTTVEQGTWHVTPPTPDPFHTTTGSLDAATGVALRPDGKVLVAGVSQADVSSRGDFAAIRLNPDLLSLDPTFNPSGAGTGTPGAVRVSPGGDDGARACLL